MSLKVTKKDFLPKDNVELIPVYSEKFNTLVDYVEDALPSDGTITADTISEETSGSGVTVDGVLLKDSSISLSTNTTLKTVEVALEASDFVGTAAGSPGHSAGLPLVAAKAGVAYELISIVIVYDYATGAFAGGNDDLVARVGTVTATGAIADADFIDKTADTVIQLGPLATDFVLTPNSTINLKSTEITAGTAAGTVNAIVTYREITTNL